MNQVAVLIPVYNGEQFLAETIESVLAQTYQDYHLYLVDDGSQDGTRAVLQRYATDERLTCISQANQGQAAALNHALQLGWEPLIAVCDADDLWRPDRLERVVAAFAADPYVGLVCNDFARGDDPQAPWESAWLTRGYRPLSGFAFERLLEENFIPRPASLLNRAELERVGGFSETIAGKCGSDDRDMWLKIARRKRIHCLHEVLTFIRIWPGQDSQTVRALESKVRLWENWVRELKGDDPWRHDRARRNLAEAWFNLGYKRLKGQRDRRQARHDFWQAAKLGHRPARAIGLMAGSVLGVV